MSAARKFFIATDLFCGGGGFSKGFALACADLGIKDVRLIAINHSVAAIEAHKLVAPWAEHHCARVDQLDPRKLVPGGRMKILIASPECFSAGALVLTAHGLTPIEEVRIGDMVLTHLGRWRNVTRIMKSVKDTVVLKGQGHYGLETTTGHPFLTPAGWRPAEEMRGQFWGNQIRYEEVPGQSRDFHLKGSGNLNFWRMVGRWVADGYAAKDDGKHTGDIAIACGADKLEPTTKVLSASGYVWKPREVRTATLFDLRNKPLWTWLTTHFGRLSHGKTIPAWLFTEPLVVRQAFLEGYLSGDGYIDDRKVQSCTVSKKLAIGIKMLAYSLGYRASIHFYPQHCSEIEGREVSVRPIYKVNWLLNPKRSIGYATPAHYFTKVSEVAQGRKRMTVYNLSVKDDESYVVDGIAVHNCTNHANARGGRPINDQSRATAWDVVKWAQELYIENILIENVREIMEWGPLGAEKRPLKSRKGETFQAWLQAIRSCGYTFEHRILNAADFGGATTRQRFFLIAKRRGRISWPVPSHAKDADKTGDLFHGLKPWRGAREIIDWDLKGESIFNRKRPLATNTIARIEAGLRKFGGPAAEPFLVILKGRSTASDINKPVPTITAQNRHIAVCEPFVLGQHLNCAPRSTDQPLPAIMTVARIALVQPFMIPIDQKSTGAVGARPVSEPVPTIITQPRVALVEPFLMKYHGNHEGMKDGETRVHSTDKPLPTVDTSNRYALVEPFILQQQSGGAPRSTKDPLPSIAAKGAQALVQPFLIPFFGERKGQKPRTHSVDEPLPVVTSHGAGALVEPFITQVNHGTDEKHNNSGRVRGIDEPLSTITPNRNHALVQPFLVKYNRTGRANSIDKPLPTVTAVDRLGLAQPTAEQHPDGIVIDILFRMLEPHELERAMGFDGHEFKGTKKHKVLMVGNAVEVNTAKALIKAILS